MSRFLDKSGCISTNFDKSWCVSTNLNSLNKNLDVTKSRLKRLDFKNLNQEKKSDLDMMDNLDTINNSGLDTKDNLDLNLNWSQLLRSPGLLFTFFVQLESWSAAKPSFSYQFMNLILYANRPRSPPSFFAGLQHIQLFQVW
jgi:hypothetical protein